jgi:imidazoleglycerol-phosphate dehydratase
MAERISELNRKTGETEIQLKLGIDGCGEAAIETGIPFFDHMLTLFSHHGLFDLHLTCTGDVEVDYHHSVEDVGLVLGEAFRSALGDKAGLVRYGHAYIPMDETLSRCVLDFSNRPLMVYRVSCDHPYIRDFNLHLLREFFQAFANACGCNLHLELIYGDEAHHIAESLFKAFARAADTATRMDPRRAGTVPSSKGTLTD